VGDVQLTILPSDNPCEHDGLVIKDGFTNGVATLSNINIPAGTSVVVVADDAGDGQEVWSSVVSTPLFYDSAASPSDDELFC
jgi:hypothetical protein